jgi:acyl-[acyl carrier protein]--UDP-N-acetylglucosamine O-acyltransferase
MKRQNIAREDIHQLRNFFKQTFEDERTNFIEKVDEVSSQYDSAVVKNVVEFIKSKSSRQFCQMKK